MLDLWSWKWAQCFSKRPHEKGTFDKFLWYTLVYKHLTNLSLNILIFIKSKL